MHPVSLCASSRLAQRGYTLVEVMVAVMIALFLLGGLLTVVQDNRRAATSQAQLAQLQDQERLAMTMITNVVQSAGYYPNPSKYSLTNMFGNTGAFSLDPKGQYMEGTGDWTAVTPNTLIARYATLKTDPILLCNGAQNGNANGGNPTTFTNTFLIQADAKGNPQLACTLFDETANTTTTYPLVDGVTNLQIRYGVKRSVTGTGVDTYVDRSLMTTTDWANLMSIQVQLTFNNPLYLPGQATAFQTIKFMRVICVMANCGVSTQ